MQDSESKWVQFYTQMLQQFGDSVDAIGCKTEKIYNYRFLAALRALSSRYPFLQDKCILDVGCGNGLFTYPFVAQNTVVGLDITWGMLSLAQKRGLLVVQGSAVCLPFRDNSFDIVIAAGVVQNLDGPDTLASECARVAKPGGTVLIETISDSLVRKIYRKLHRGPGIQVRAYSVRDVLMSMQKAGLGKTTASLLYYPFTHKHVKIVSTVGIRDRLFSSAFIVIGEKDSGNP